VSKERARRRAEREAAAAEQRRRREAQRKRAATRASVASAVSAPVTRSGNALTRWWRRRYPKGDPLAPRRRRRFLILLAIFLGIQAVGWFLFPEWNVRLLVLMVSALVLPVINVLLFDRR
jgi:hypothetical protein